MIVNMSWVKSAVGKSSIETLGLLDVVGVGLSGVPEAARHQIACVLRLGENFRTQCVTKTTC